MRKMLGLAAVAVMLCGMAASVKAQTAAVKAEALAGDYAGTLGPLHIRVHIQVKDGVLTGTMDSLDQGASGIECKDFKLEGQSLSFLVPAVYGAWKGTVSADAQRLTGTWKQGAEMPLVLERYTFTPAVNPSIVDGIWLGSLQAGEVQLRIQVHVYSDAAGKEYCTMDSLDQHAKGLACNHVKFAGMELAFEVPSVKGSWEGRLSEDRQTLTGTWTQGQKMRLDMSRERQEKDVAPYPPKGF